MHYKEVQNYQVHNNVINREELLRRVDRDYELLEELFSVFIEDWPIQLKDIEEAINHSDFGRLKISAHRLKGSLGNLAANEAYNLAMKMEIAASQSELETVQHIYPNLVKQIHLVMDALESLVRNRQF